jgi:prepilin-type N-terminal cleavage/methylation domain-containing protein/prepilin-type processing-associated H-X9-DG protein
MLPTKFDRRQPAFTLIELLVVIAIVGVLVAIMLPAIGAARDAARRTGCVNNLHQIATAMHSYQSAHRSLPSASRRGLASGSAFVTLLPYLEEKALFDRYSDDLSPTVGTNSEVAGIRLPIYVCPSMVLPREVPDRGCGEVAAIGSYSLSTGTEKPWYKHTGAIIASEQGRTTIPRISEKDGASKTLLIGEFDYDLKDLMWTTCDRVGPRYGTAAWAIGYPGMSWASTYGVFNSDRLINGTDEWITFRSDHPGGVQFAMVDGSVRFVADSIDATVLNGLATRDGAEPVPGEF